MSEKQKESEEIKDRVVIITGASGGLGKGTARVFVESGWRVAMFGRDEKKLEDARNEIDETNEKKDDILIQPANVTDFKAVVGAVGETKKAFNHQIDVLINIAGMPQQFEEKDGGKIKPTIDLLKEKQWDELINVNLTGVFHMCKAVFPLMQEQESGGYIVNISSVVGKRGVDRATAYCASKSALTGFTQALSEEGKKSKKSKIRCSVIYLGGLYTKFTNDEPNPKYLKPQSVGRFLFHLVNQASNMVVNEAVITPIVEKNYP